MQRLLARTLELGFGACGWREPGMQGESSIDLYELVKPLLVGAACLLGGSALIAFVVGMLSGGALRVLVKRKISWWWILGGSVLIGIGGLAWAINLLVQGFR